MPHETLQFCSDKKKQNAAILFQSMKIKKNISKSYDEVINSYDRVIA